MTKPAVPQMSTARYQTQDMSQSHLKLVGTEDCAKPASVAIDKSSREDVRTETDADLDDMWDNVPV